MVYWRRPGPEVLAGFTAWLDQAIKTDEHRPPQGASDGPPAVRAAAGTRVCRPLLRVTEYLRAKRSAVGAVTARSAYVPLQFGWGEAFQFDWSEEGLESPGPCLLNIGRALTPWGAWLARGGCG